MRHVKVLPIALWLKDLSQKFAAQTWADLELQRRQLVNWKRLRLYISSTKIGTAVLSQAQKQQLKVRIKRLHASDRHVRVRPLHFSWRTLVWYWLHKLELILNCKVGSPSTENGYGHTSAAQSSGLQSCQRHKNNTKSESSVFSHLFSVSGCFLLHFGWKALALHLQHKLELILNCKEGSPSSVFTHLFDMLGCFLLHFGRKTLVWYWLHKLELILNCKVGLSWIFAAQPWAVHQLKTATVIHQQHKVQGCRAVNATKTTQNQNQACSHICSACQGASYCTLAERP